MAYSSGAHGSMVISVMSIVTTVLSQRNCRNELTKTVTLLMLAVIASDVKFKSVSGSIVMITVPPVSSGGLALSIMVFLLPKLVCCQG
jgi:hypothetical protein